MRRAFVITIALTACGGSERQADAPPSPKPPSTLGPPCAADAKRDSPCSQEGSLCAPPGAIDGCGLNGYECKTGRWQGVYTLCNPPEAFED